MGVHITIINKSNDLNNSSIVIYGGTAAAPIDGPVTALRVVDAPVQGRSETFDVPAHHAPKIWIGTSPGGAQGQTVSIYDGLTPLSLAGLASADIIMTGGGPGRGTTPFVFTLANAVAA
jgi:hypothetical protein